MLRYIPTFLAEEVKYVSLALQEERGGGSKAGRVLVLNGAKLKFEGGRKEHYEGQLQKKSLGTLVC